MSKIANQLHDFEYNSDQLLKVVLAFNSESDYVNLLNVLLTNIMELTCSDAATLYMLEGNKLHFRILKNNTLNIFKVFDAMDDKDYLPPITLDKENITNVSAYCAIYNEVVLEEDVYTSTRFNFSGPKHYDKLTGYKTRSMLVLPLVSLEEETEEVLGVIQLLNATNPITGEPMPYGDISTPPVVMALSKIAANTLGNLTHIQEIHQIFHSFVEVMTQAIDERSPFTKNHTQKVSIYCSAFAEYLSNTFPVGHPYHFTKRHKDRLVMAALLHDIGKIVTPMHIMDKANRLFSWQFEYIRDRFEIKKHQLEIDYLSNRLTKEEWDAKLLELNTYFNLIETINSSHSPLSEEQVMLAYKMANITYRDYNGNEVPILNDYDITSITIRQGTLSNKEREIIQDHVSATGRLLDKIISWKYYKDVAKWAKDHHEFLDGSGYPNGLKGNDISIETCIITITDIFDALTAADRPYRKHMPIDRALDVLQKMVQEGKLHKELVELFIKSKLWEGIER
ncbi:MAG: HD domain-containing protein [Defluviitaleaceae bacterium]|nr:HD domain-containing protein [Defluviitaleaceae bacterium]